MTNFYQSPSDKARFEVLLKVCPLYTTDAHDEKR